MLVGNNGKPESLAVNMHSSENSVYCQKLFPVYSKSLFHDVTLALHLLLWLSDKLQMVQCFTYHVYHETVNHL